MRFCRFIAARAHLGSRPPAVAPALILSCFFSCAALLCAQEPLPPETPTTLTATPYVLHAYADLVQIPTVILSDTFSQLPPIPREDINISLDSGPLFHPTHIRIEDKDPLDLAILLDLSGPGYSIRSDFSHAIADFVSRSLLPGDRLSVYVTDCMLLRSVTNLPATDGTAVERVINKELLFPGLHGQSTGGPGCTQRNHLWNVLATMATSMTDTHRRRVILAVSTGIDHKSHIKWDQLKRFAGSRSIAIFGLYPEFDSGEFNLQLPTENPFDSLCQLTGGMLIDTLRGSIGLDMSRLTDLVRNRYILEFPRPDVGKSGQHSITVTLSSTSAFIRPAGITYLLPDPASLTDPTTIPSPPSPAVYGKRSTLKPPQ